MGAPIDNGNLGCMALTYSLLSSLEDIAKETGDDFNYFIFDGTNNQNKINEFSTFHTEFSTALWTKSNFPHSPQSLHIHFRKTFARFSPVQSHFLKFPTFSHPLRLLL